MQEEVVTVKKAASAKSVNFFYALILVYGNIVGSGIFITVQDTFTVFDSPSIGMVIIFWTIAGMVSLIGGLCYVELGTRIPESGGERAYYFHILNRKFARVFVIFYVFIIRSLVMAGLGITAGTYLGQLITSDTTKEYVPKLIALGCLILCLIVNSISKKVVVNTGAALTLLKTIAILIIICGGCYFLAKGQTPEWTKPFTFEEFTVKKLGICFINLFWTYEGWNTLGLIAGDMVNPARDLLAATIVGMLAVVVFYVLTVISYSAILGYNTVINTQALGVLVGQKLLHKAYPVIVILIACSALGSANGTLFTISAASTSAGITGDLPKIFALVHRKTRTPIFSIFVIIALCCFYLLFDFKTILNYCAFLTWTFYFISFFCLWKIKLQTRKQPNKKIFQIPYIFIIPLQLVCVFVIGTSFYLEWKGCLIVLIIFLLTLLFMYIPKRFTQFKFLSRLQDGFISFANRRLGLEVATENDIK